MITIGDDGGRAVTQEQSQDMKNSVLSCEWKIAEENASRGAVEFKGRTGG